MTTTEYVADYIVFHAGTKLVDGKVVTAGGRVFTVVGMGDTLVEAVDRAYLGVRSIEFRGMFFRRDIAERQACLEFLSIVDTDY